MPWIKRNLSLVVGGVVAVALLGLAGWFLWSKMQLDRSYTEQLEASKSRLMGLVTREPHPGTDELDNISAAQQEVKKLESFNETLTKFFPNPQVPSQLGNREFRSLLDNSIAELQQLAKSSGVKIPEDYWFTFDDQRRLVNFDQKSLEPMAAQLIEIRRLSEILFDAKIISLTSLKRASVSTNDTTTSAHFVEEKIATNQWAIVSPYEVTFEGFGSELSRVIEGLIQSPVCFVVKNMSVEPAPPRAPEAPAGTYPTPYTQPYNPRYNTGNPYGNRYTPNPYGGGGRYGANPYAGNPRYAAGGGSGGIDPSLAARYGIGGATPQQQTSYAPTLQQTGRGGLQTALEAKPLRITLQIDAVRHIPPQTEGAVSAQ